MMTLREKVARAIASADGFNDHTDTDWLQFVDDADAAIAAIFDHLAEPSESMLSAGNLRRLDPGMGCREVWQAMLVVALKEACR